IALALCGPPLDLHAASEMSSVQSCLKYRFLMRTMATTINGVASVTPRIPTKISIKNWVARIMAGGRYTIRCNHSPFGRGRCSGALLYEVSHFLFIILTIEDFPLPTAFGNGALLALDLLPGGLIDFFFFFEPFDKDVDDGETDRVSVLDKFHFVDRRELLGNLMGQQIDFL